MERDLFIFIILLPVLTYVASTNAHILLPRLLSSTQLFVIYPSVSSWTDVPLTRNVRSLFATQKWLYLTRGAVPPQ
jgi:hypothetical protein